MAYPPAGGGQAPVPRPGAPYTANQWLQLPAGKRGFKSYGRYVNWWNQTVKPRLIPDRKPAVAGTPPKPPPFLNPAIPSYLQPTPEATLRANAQSQVDASIRPILDQLQKQYAEQQTRIGGQFTTQRTQGVADIQAAQMDWLAGLSKYSGVVGGAYDEAIQGQKQVDAGIQSFLAQQGKGVMEATTQQAQQAGAPAAAIAALGGQQGELGIGGAVTGTQQEAVGAGASTMSRLLGEKAGEVSYAQGLPNYARQQGAQDLTQFERDIGTRQASTLAEIAANRDTAIGQVTSGVPGLIQDVYSNLLQNETSKAGLLGNFRQDAAERQYNVWATKYKAKIDKQLQTQQIKAAGGGAGGKTYAPKGFQLQFAKDGTPFLLNKSTGETQALPGNYAPPKGPAATTAAGKALTKLQDGALKFAQNLYKPGKGTAAQKIPPGPDNNYQGKTIPAQPGKRTPNIKAIPAVVLYYRQRAHGKSEEWIMNQAATTLVQAGYSKAAGVLQSPASYYSWLNKYGGSEQPTAPTAPTPGAKAPAAPAPKGQKPPATTKPQKLPPTAPSERGQSQAQTAQQQQEQIRKQKAQAATAAAQRGQSVAADVADWTDTFINRRDSVSVAKLVDTPEHRKNYEQALTNSVQHQFPKMKPQDVRAIVRAAVDRWQFKHQRK